MWIDLGIMLLFVVYSVSVGFYLQKAASRGLVDYFLAGRTLKGWQSGFSMAATQYAADTPLLVAGLVATGGIFSLWRLWVYAIAFLLLGFILGACWRRAAILTDAEFTEVRYSGNGAALLRALKALHMGTLINCTILAMVLMAATRIAEQFLLWHLWLPPGWLEPLAGLLQEWNLSFTTLAKDAPMKWIISASNLISIGVIVTFTWLYSTTGGLRSVVATDVIQFLIAMVATACFAFTIVYQIGGFSEMGVQLKELYGVEATSSLLSFGPTNWGTGTLMFLSVLAIQWFAQVNSDGTGYLAQRTMACKDDHEAQKAAVIFTFAQVVVRSLLWLPIVIGLLILYPADSILDGEKASDLFRISREGTFARGIRDFLPAGLRGLMLTGMIAALASTVDTHLNWGASYWTNDLYKRFLMEKFLRRRPSQKELVWVARLSNLGILAFSLWLVGNLGSIQATWHLALLFGSGLGMVLILRWIWYRINLWSEFAAGIASLVLAPILLLYFPENQEGARLLVMVGVTSIVTLAATLLTSPEPATTLITFYKRVRPPGFWKPIATQVGEDSNKPLKEFKRSLLAMSLATISVFGLLLGVGQLMVDAILNESSWYPLLLIVLALLLIPLWVRLGFQKKMALPQKNTLLDRATLGNKSSCQLETNVSTDKQSVEA